MRSAVPGGLLTASLLVITAVAQPVMWAAPTANCAATAIDVPPLTELDARDYMGFDGGLYPGGTNEPPSRQRELAAVAAAQVEPLDAAGVPAQEGRVVLLAVGMSNTTLEYQAFLRLSWNDRTLSRKLALVDGAQGGHAASDIVRPEAPYWRVVDQRLRVAGLSPAQVQVIWLKQANRQPSEPFPVHAQALTDDLAEVVRVATDRFPNLRLIYLSSRIYAGYATSALNPEPYAYESAFSVRWLIERQMNGEPGLNADPASGPVGAPVLLWGPYLWADGLRPRADGLTWRCEDFSADGTHPSGFGQAKVAALLMNFFKREPSARPWFLADPNAPTPTTSPTATPRSTLAPGTGTPHHPTPGGPTMTPRPTAVAASLRSFRVLETPSGDAIWVGTTVKEVQERLRFVSHRQPSWLCAAVMADPAAEWGFRFEPAPMSLVRSAFAAWRTTVRAISADPAGAAAAGQPLCILVDDVLAEVEGPPPLVTGAPSVTPPHPGGRVVIPWAGRWRP